MKYIFKTITNEIGDASGTRGNEGFFYFQILKTLKIIFGNRISFEESTPYFTNSMNHVNNENQMDFPFNESNCFPSNEQAESEKDNIQNYNCSIVIDGIWSFLLKRDGGTASNSTTGLNLSVPGISTTSGTSVTSSSNIPYTSLDLRKIYIKIIEQENFLSISFQKYNSQSAFNIIVLKNNDLCALSLTALPSSSSNVNAPISKIFLSNNVYTQYKLGPQPNISSGPALKINDRFLYNCNINNNNKVEIASGKKALLNKGVEGVNNTVVTTFSSLYDCSYLPADLVYTINGEEYLALNNYTLLKINNGVSNVETLVQQTTPSESEPEGE